MVADKGALLSLHLHFVTRYKIFGFIIIMNIVLQVTIEGDLIEGSGQE